MFVCKGTQFREDYLLDAENKGAVGYLSEKRYTCVLPMIIVNDVEKAVMDLKKDEVLVIADKGCERDVEIWGKKIPYEGDDCIVERVLQEKSVL